MAKRETCKYRCGDCANVTVKTDFHTLSVRGEPTVGTCPHWTEGGCVLLSWMSSCTHYIPRKAEG